jgi:hypothetical protein
MGIRNWMKRNNGSNAIPEAQYLTHDERSTLRRMVQRLDDGLVGKQERGDWEKTFNQMADRLMLRPSDPFGDRAKAISPEEAKALGEFQKMYEQAADSIYPGSPEMKSDACSIRDALDRSGRPQNSPAREMQSEGVEKAVRRATPSWER